MNDRTRDDVAYLQAMAARLERSPRVQRCAAEAASSSTEIATEAADSLVDIRRSAELMTQLLPKLFSQGPESAAFDDTLDDIGEELRHIHYHIVNTKLFDYVVTRG